MPKKIQDFAKTALVDAVVINVGRAGAANLDVIQEVEYVKQEAKLVYLLKCLQKTPPPAPAAYIHGYYGYIGMSIILYNIYLSNNYNIY